MASVTARRMTDWLPRGYPVEDAEWRARHRSVLWLVAAHIVGLLIFGLVRDQAVVHVVLELLPIVGVALLARVLSDHSHIAMAATFALMLCSATLVHMSGGSIEAHFHFFVVIGVVTIYQSWKPFAVAIGFVLAHHTTLGIVHAESVYNHPDAQRRPWLWAGIHAGFVLGSALASLRLWKHVETERLAAQRSAVAQREHSVRLQGAAAINDTIVQDLVTARFASDLGDPVIMRASLDIALERAQDLVASLMRAEDEAVQPGELRTLAMSVDRE